MEKLMKLNDLSIVAGLFAVLSVAPAASLQAQQLRRNSVSAFRQFNCFSAQYADAIAPYMQ
jgi:hypothetical protein